MGFLPSSNSHGLRRLLLPTTPVLISITPETSVSAGSVSTFLVTASTMLASDSFVVEVVPALGSEWISGPLQWQGSIEPGQVQELRVSLRMPTVGVPSVTANASIQASDGSRLAASAEYRLQQIMPAGAQKLNSGRKRLRNGSPVIEYTVK